MIVFSFNFDSHLLCNVCSIGCICSTKPRKEHVKETLNKDMADRNGKIIKAIVLIVARDSAYTGHKTYRRTENRSDVGED